MVPKEHLIAGYDRSAARYDAVVGQQYLMGIWGLLPLVRLPQHPAILDAGCGTGAVLLALAKVYAPCRLLVGVDLSPGMVAQARQKAAAEGIPATYYVSDIEQLPLRDQTFDLAVCSGVYHWLEDQEAAVRELARILRPGGVLLLTGVAAPGFQEWIDLCRAVWRRLFGSSAEPWFPPMPTPEALEAQLLRAGFRITLLQHPVQSVTIDDPDSFVRYMAATAPNWLAGLSAAEGAQVEQELLRTLQTEYPSGFPCTSASLVAVAERA